MPLLEHRATYTQILFTGDMFYVLRLWFRFVQDLAKIHERRNRLSLNGRDEISAVRGVEKMEFKLSNSSI